MKRLNFLKKIVLDAGCFAVPSELFSRVTSNSTCNVSTSAKKEIKTHYYHKDYIPKIAHI